MRDFLPLWAIAGILGVVVCVIIWAAAAQVDGGDTNKNEHARACVAAGNTIKEKEQYGGKWHTYTWWCVDSDGQITDIWFD